MQNLTVFGYIYEMLKEWDPLTICVLHIMSLEPNFSFAFRLKLAWEFMGSFGLYL